MNVRHRSVLVTGANGVVGPCLCELLQAESMSVGTLGRAPGGHLNGIVADLGKPESLVLNERFDLLIHMAPLWLLPQNLERFTEAGVKRMIAFSSTSAGSKQDSHDASDRELAGALLSAEEQVRKGAADSGIGLTLFRPTMIYGFGRDGNVSAIVRMIRRLGFFPIAGAGSGLRQPVHALDLAVAAQSCMDSETAIDKTYNLGGADILNYREMVQRIFQGMARTPRILHLPTPLYRTLIGIAVRANVIGGVSSGAADRMNEDLSFDTAPAQNDFGYRGSAFLDNPARDLPT